MYGRRPPLRLAQYGAWILGGVGRAKRIFIRNKIHFATEEDALPLPKPAPDKILYVDHIVRQPPKCFPEWSMRQNRLISPEEYSSSSVIGPLCHT